MEPLLTISDLHAEVHGKSILRGLSLSIAPGEIHAIMGPNGSGKSTLANVLMGHPHVTITKGSVRFHGKDLLALPVHERATLGLFLAFQYPKEIAGVTLRSFLFAAFSAQRTARGEEKMSPVTFKKLLDAAMGKLGMDPAFAERQLNVGFSGGEKKKAEVLQLALLAPSLAILDETDSGLDVDALRIVSTGVENLRSPDFSAIVITHYARILDLLTPDRVHVMVGGTIVESGGPELAQILERDGYAKYGVRGKPASIPLEVNVVDPHCEESSEGGG